MERHKVPTAGGLLRALVPLAVYYLLSLVVAWAYGQILTGRAGFLLLESGQGKALFQEYFQQELRARSMEILLVTAAMGIPLFGWMYCQDIRRRETAGSQGPWKALELRPLLWPVLAGAALSLLLNLLLLKTPLPGWAPGYVQAEEGLLGGSLGMELLALGLCSPILEELLMRGLLFGRLRELVGAKQAAFCSALIFGVYHQNLLQGVYAFLMGLFFAYLLESLKTILAPILAHMSANILILLLSEDHWLERLLESGAAFAAAVLGCACLLAGFAVRSASAR